MAVQFDATANGGSSYSHTCASDATYLFALVEHGLTDLTYNGVAMTLLSSYHPTFGTFAANCAYVDVWGLASPASGTHTVAWTGTGRVVSASYKGILAVTHGNDSASVGGQTTTWESTVTLGTNDWGIAFFAGANNFPRTFDAYTNSTLRGQDNGGLGMAIMDSNGVQTPGSYSLWGIWNSGSGFVTATTFSVSVVPTTMTKTETVTITDAVVRAPGRLLNEAVTIVDSVARGVNRLLTQTITLTDSLVNIKGTWFQVAYTETIALTDSIVNSFVFFITAVENLTITDAVLDFAKKLRGLLRGKNNNTNIKTGVRRT